MFITLGLKLNNAGQLESEAIGRLEKTLEAYKNYKASYIIVSGGNSKNKITEARAMKNWLQKNDVPHYRIIEENHSKDTVENAIYSMDIVNKKNFNSVTLITSDTHIRRAYILFKKLDCQNKISSIITSHTTTNTNNYQEENYLIKKNLEKLNKKINNDI
ncbi:YdcF family protein [Staphylococcus xylosus]